MNDDRDSELWKLNPLYCRDSIGCLFFVLIIVGLFVSAFLEK